MEITQNTPAPQHLPSVLAFRRAVVITDAPLEYLAESGEIKPVPVILHGTMGTQNVNKKEAASASTAGDGERDVRNLQVIESAKTGADMRALMVGFKFKAISLADTLHSCASAAAGLKAESEKMRAMITDFVARARDSEGVQEICRRIARNILNARWLWRNRLMASDVRVVVRAGEKEWEVRSFGLPLNDFENYTDAEREIGAALATQLRGESAVAFDVSATVDLGVTGAVEVYGSQNYEPDTQKGNGKGKLSRSLYKLGTLREHESGGVRVVGQAAIRDAKIWNALRTIDTWYADYEEIGVPMPVEPLGASLSMMRFMRDKKDSAFSLFKRLHQIDPASSDGMFCIAIMMRGGVLVLGEEEKSRKGSASKGSDAATQAPLIEPDDVE